MSDVGQKHNPNALEFKERLDSFGPVRAREAGVVRHDQHLEIIMFALPGEESLQVCAQQWRNAVYAGEPDFVHAAHLQAVGKLAN
jgi:hypothetical protein